jgi:hypothetical protein
MKEQTMHYWTNLFQTFNKSQMLIGGIEQMTREEQEMLDETWTTVDDVSPEQRKYEDTLEIKEQEEMPF